MVQRLIGFFVWFFVLLAIIYMFMGKADAKAETNTKWTIETHRLNGKIINMGVDGTLSAFIINKCKATAKDPRKCVLISISIYWNESWFWKYCKNHSCWWVISKSYKSQIQAADDWVDRYNRHWYKAKDGTFFYSLKGKLPPSRYCTSEVSSNSKVGCPNWLRNYAIIYNKIAF